MDELQAGVESAAINIALWVSLPVPDWERELVARYSDADMARFMEEDKLGEATVLRVRRMLEQGVL
jgi:hypothetical protein